MTLAVRMIDGLAPVLAVAVVVVGFVCLLLAVSWVAFEFGVRQVLVHCKVWGAFWEFLERRVQGRPSPERAALLELRCILANESAPIWRQKPENETARQIFLSIADRGLASDPVRRVALAARKALEGKTP